MLVDETKKIGIIGEAVHGINELGPRRRHLLGLLVLYLLTTVFESFGIGLLLPIAHALQSGGLSDAAVRDQAYWKYLYLGFETLGLKPDLVWLLLLSFVLFMVRNGLTYFRQIAFTAQLQNVIQINRTKGMELFLGAKMSYQEGTSPGTFANDLAVQVVTAIGAIFSFVILFHVVFMGIYYIGFLMLLSWELTLAISLISVAAALAARPLSKYARKTGDILVVANGATSSFLVERISSARLIRLGRTERAETVEMSRRCGDQKVAEKTLQRYSATASLLVETIIVGCGFLLLFFGTTVLQLDLATIGLALIILIRQLPVARELIITRHAIVSNLPAVKRVTALFREMRSQAEIDDGVLVLNGLQRGIEIKNVNFRYQANEKAVLHDVCLHIPARKITALVGPSGGGKSTLIDLLPRLRESDSGSILIDGVSILEFKRSSLRSQIAYIPQSPQIFNVTVEQHIRYGKADASDKEVQLAASLAGASVFIESWADGFRTMLGESGARMSGGQRQRLDLARALVSGAPILILDEPTSNLDAETEKLFRETLIGIQRKTPKTIILVGHNLANVKFADTIAVMQNGSIGEIGTHEELLANGRWYLNAFEIQQGRASATA